MHRRFFVLALAAVACAPTGGTPEKTAPSSPPDAPTAKFAPARPKPTLTPAPPKPTLAPGNPLLAIGNWSAPVAGWDQWLAVYDDGLVELRSFENSPQPANPFAQELRIRVLRVPPAELETLRASLSNPRFKSAKPDYHERGVLDGGALTIADMSTHHRRVIVVNTPPRLPKAVASAKDALNDLVKEARDNGKDGFAPGPDRIELFYMFTQGEETRALTVYEHGRLELRTTYTSNAEAHEAADYPTPYAITGQAEPADLEALRSALSELPTKPPPVAFMDATPDLLIVGSATREFRVAKNPSEKMSSALTALADVIDALESS